MYLYLIYLQMVEPNITKGQTQIFKRFESDQAFHKLHSTIDWLQYQR